MLTARFTPGHTPEHLAYSVAEEGREDDPWAVLSGDSLFVDSAGRPDLLGDKMGEQLVEQLFHTLRDVYLAMADHVIVYPCHGAGSECGPDIGDRLASTIGHEGRHNPYLRCDSLDRFRELMLGAAPPVPAHYPRLKQVNAAGPTVLGAGPQIPALPPARFKTAIERSGAPLVDVRHMLAFGGGHIPGALIIPDQPILSVWAGWMLDPEAPILLVLEQDRDLARILPLFVRTGYTRFAGYLAGGMTAWEDAGLPLARLPQITVHELEGAGPDLQILDVRAPDEWAAGHIPGAVHCFVPELKERVGEFDAKRPVATYCGSGYRANIAASLLQAHGFTDVRSVPGSCKAWRAAGFPTEQ